MIALGIETSCDETAAALVDAERHVHADLVLSQLDAHRAYGGVVPEIAARSHIDHLDRLIARALDESGLSFEALDCVAATAGPGLIGGVMVGLMTAKAIAAVHGLPLIAVNHLEAHALSARLQAEIDFPFLVLLISGGHCQWLIAEGVGRFRRLGTTLDDAIGEAFDKSARLLGLGYPGGPALERAAENGDATRFDLPRPLRGRAGCDFSFSGLKTAVGGRVAALGGTEALSARDRADLAAAVQAAIADVLVDRLGNAVAGFRARHRHGRHLVVAGGVAANATLRARLDAAARAHGLILEAPPPDLCTDNAVMVAWAGLERLKLGLVDGLDAPARARWPLDPEAAPAIGAGVKA